jgi:3-oxoacyl-[acyl-carrier-protein] synthase-3
MLYRQVDIAAVACLLPEIRVTSAELERRLAPLYQRLRLSEGRLELMTGIRERRFWASGTMPGAVAAEAGRRALQKASIEASALGALIFCGVSRDCAEPATATGVSEALNLPPQAVCFDVSNACLGVATGMMLLADMIELGQIDWGLAVTGENSAPLVNNTIEMLNTDMTVTRQSLKSQFASLTIGSCAAAVLLCRRNFCPHAHHRLLASATASDCRGSRLCQGQADGAMTDGSKPLMVTDSTQLMQQGIQVASVMWRELCRQAQWTPDNVSLVCGHQVGKVHRDLLFEELQLPTDKDFPAFPFLGNCGSASLPATVALAEEQGALRPGDNLAMLGIGSGINSAGFAVQW